MLAACAAAAAVAPDIKVLKGRVVSGDQFVSPAGQKEHILATFGDLCCEMEGCTIAQAAYLNGVPLVVVRAISDKPCAEGQVVDYNTFEKKAACDCARIAERMVKL
ncbi:MULTISPECIES: 5'-methylthioadenosine/S-adenosylhomocysteine nucleosidase [Collinsella]|uniref:5'-methylthioadenosine/S-adenosylhomocysteine nucleosidase n=1 Tax=Collinsella TaxID=102106 RepID=UPI001314E4DC|nr:MULTISPECIES: 5'-methylthioadenosine/S-adenosylhomocysteine nucleosidase [Collinsella]